MTTPTAIEVNCETGEVIERPLTAEEIAQKIHELEMEHFPKVIERFLEG